MIELVRKLFEMLHSREVLYCHWKSNRNLDYAVQGKEDLDILVDRESIGLFLEIIQELGFKAISQPKGEQSYSIRHFYGLNSSTGILVHIHVHYRLVTGGAILKNYRLKIEAMLFESRRQISGVFVPSKAAELLILVIRKILESASIIEAFMLFREKEAVQKEIAWLLQDGDAVLYDENGVYNLLKIWFPGIDRNVFISALENLKDQWNIFRMFFLGKKMASALRQYAIHSRATTSCLRSWYFIEKIVKRLAMKRRTHTFLTGGIVIAIVGADATGKSTIVKMLTSWLSEYFKVYTHHVGKPPSSFTTWLPNKFMPFLRKMLPRYRTGNIEAEVQDGGTASLRGIRLLVFIVRSLMIAHDRKRILTKIYRQATKGSIVICDRYPTPILGAMDSRQVDCALEAVNRNVLFNFLAKYEEGLYRKMSPPDIVVKLSVPVNTAIKRNVTRIKAGIEDESWVRRRHKQSKLQNYPKSITFNIDTSKNIAPTFLKIKESVWSLL